MATKAKPKPAGGKKAAAKPNPKPKGKAGKKIEKCDPWNTPEYLAAYDSETWEKVRVQSHDIFALQAEFESVDLKAKALRAELKAAQEARDQYMRERDELRGKKPGTLFDDLEMKETLKSHAEREKEKAATHARKKAEEQGPKLTGWYPENLYELYPLERLVETKLNGKTLKMGLTDKTLKFLLEGKCKTGPDFGPIDTMGRLKDYQRQIGEFERRLADVKGIGPAAVTEIENANLKFWSYWPMGLADAFAVECGYKPPAEEKPNADQAGSGDASPAGSGEDKGDGGKPKRARTPAHKPAGQADAAVGEATGEVVGKEAAVS